MEKHYLCPQKLKNSMTMNKKLTTLLIFFSMLIASQANAQCTFRNTALSGNEKISYNLYFNWKFIWVKAGTANMNTVYSTFNGTPSFKCSLTTTTSKKVDKFFMLRDTLLVHSSRDMAPLYYKKVAHEGKRYYVDEATYSYPNGKCAVSMRHLHSDGTVSSEKKTYDHCVFDMLNIFLRARNFDPTNWKKGHVVNIDITGGSELTKAKLIYRGKDKVKADNGTKYDCLVLSYVEKDGNKDKEIVRFFVTDDAKHIPIRLDLFLKFGAAKAFLA